MHMADALLSPAVGATMWTATAITAAYCAKKVRDEDDPARIPLMGVAGAFVFASQMLNFTIPGTGSSGHLGGGLILALLLGPEAAFLVMASVLGVQALFFGDGGLLALGANVFNLGFFPAFIAFPLIFRPIAKDCTSRGRVITASIVAAIVALQLGAFGVVLETVTSGVSQVPFSAFVVLMQPIHLAIGVVEGLVTAGVVLFVTRVQPELLSRTTQRKAFAGLNLRPVLVGLTVVAIIAGGTLAWFASTSPDGLEWSVTKVAGPARPAAPDGIHTALEDFQALTAILPGYAFKKPVGAESPSARAWPAVDAGTSVSGVLGAGVVALVAVGAGFVLRRRKRRA